MIFVKENFSFINENVIGVYDYYEQVFRDYDFDNVINANISFFKNTIFLYLKYRNELGVESESYYHIVSDNTNDFKEIDKLIHSKVAISYAINEKHFSDYMNKLYPEIEGDYTYDTFLKELGDFDKVVDYNWNYLKICYRVKLVKYALGLDYQDDADFSNKTYSEIKSRFKNREINSQIDYETLGNIIEDGAKKVYENSYKQDWEEYNKWYAQEILGKWSKEEKENKGMRSLYEMFEEARRVDAGILTPKIESIYANKKKRTIVIKWQTGETTKVTCHDGDTWDLEKGIMACITKYVLGNNYNAGNILNKYINSVKYSDNK